MPHRHPRIATHRCINDSLAGGPFTRAGHKRTYGGLDRAGVSPDGIPLLLHDSIDATAARAVRTAPFATTIVSGPPDEPAAPSARGAPTRYVHRAIPGPVPPGSLRASLSHPPVRASHQPRIPFHQRCPVFRMDAPFAAIGPNPWTWRTRFPGPGGTGQKFCAEVLTTTRAETPACAKGSVRSRPGSPPARGIGPGRLAVPAVRSRTRWDGVFG